MNNNVELKEKNEFSYLKDKKCLNDFNLRSSPIKVSAKVLKSLKIKNKSTEEQKEQSQPKVNQTELVLEKLEEEIALINIVGPIDELTKDNVSNLIKASANEKL